MRAFETDPKDANWRLRLEQRLLVAREQRLQAQRDYWNMIDGLPMNHPDEDDAHE